MHMSIRVRFVFVKLLVLGLLAPATLAQARRTEPRYEQEEPLLTYNLEVLAKAQPDECYGGLGVPATPPEGPPCDDPQVPKVNQAYVWGLARALNSLWFGTGPNTHCLVMGGFLQMTDPIETDLYACEFGDNTFDPELPAAIGDWRPPQIFRYSLVKPRGLKEFTPDDPLIEATMGIRSAGSLGPWVLLGGPVVPGSGLEGINLFAFEAATGKYLGSINLPEYDNIRKWLEHEGVLYTAVGRTDGGGAVLRVEPLLPAPPAPEFPFDFEEVGLTPDGEGSELAVYDGRLFISTWPDLQDFPSVGLAGLYMSPPIPGEGLTGPAANYVKVWQINEYEPDFIVALATGGGALASFDGDLYWGTMHVPLLAYTILTEIIGLDPPPGDESDWMFNSNRAIEIFRGRNFGTPGQQVELLYGEEYLPVFDLFGTQTWSNELNNMGVTPSYGGSGFGYLLNNYTWVMEVWQEQLLVGTMDFTILLYSLLGEDIPEEYLEQVGADLYRFPSGSDPAVPESLTGVGNWASYGIRTVVSDEDAVYLGMANPMNLLTDPNDDLPEGGWELLELTEPLVSPCGLGAELVLVLPMIMWVGAAARRRGRRSTRV